MGDSTSVFGPSRTFVGSDNSTSVRKSRGRLIASAQKSFEHQSLKKLPSHLGWINPGELGRRVAAGPVTSFLVEVAVLEIVRRFSKAKCPWVWSTLQTLQVFCYPPFKWLQRWNPFRALVKGMQILSRPLLVISIGNAISNCSEDQHNLLDDEEPSQASESAALNSHLHESSLLSPAGISSNEDPHISSSKTWLLQLHEELQREGVTLPERIDDDELERFYATANGNLSVCLSLVKKTASWRETYRFLSVQELEVWSNMVFWHGYDAKGRLCLVVRLGLACMTVPFSDRPRFAQAIVSQVEYGVLNLMDHEHSRITVLVDCEGVSPLKFPMKISLTCANILQEHIPKRLGCVYVIRLPPVARVIARSFIHFLKPATRAKLKILGDSYIATLSEVIKELPSCLGGLCTCIICTGEEKCISEEFSVREADFPSSIENTARQDVLPDFDATYDSYTWSSSEQVLRKAVLGVLIFWVMIALLAGIYDPDSTPF